MFDFRERGNERVCINCVVLEAEELSRPATSAEMVACGAAMQAMLKELHCVATADTSPRAAAQICALVETASTLVDLMTRANVGDRGIRNINKNAIIHLLAGYEATWGRVLGKVSIAGTFVFWMQGQAKNQQQPERGGTSRR